MRMRWKRGPTSLLVQGDDNSASCRWASGGAGRAARDADYLAARRLTQCRRSGKTAGNGVREASAPDRNRFKRGANLVISDLDEAAGAARTASLKNAYLRHSFTVESDWEACIAATRSLCSLDGPCKQCRDAGNENHRRDVYEVEQVMSVNMDGVFLGVKHGIGTMKEKGGSIINSFPSWGIGEIVGPTVRSRAGAVLNRQLLNAKSRADPDHSIIPTISTRICCNDGG